MGTRAEKGGLGVLLYDVESFPNVSYTWGYYEQNVIKVIHKRMICSLAWQWYPKKEVNVLALPDFPDYDPKVRSNRKLLSAFREQLMKADIAIGHNIENFDDRRVNTDLIKIGKESHIHHRTVDTLKLLRSKFDFNSNKLGDVCEELGIGKKLKHPGFEMWERCMAGDLKAWDIMKRYNRHDVDPLLRGLYERLRSWFPNHPNLAVGEKGKACPRCKNAKDQDIRPWSHQYTQAQVYQRMYCRACNSWFKKVPVKGGGFVYRP